MAEQASVLIVDDVQDMCDLLSLALQDNGYQTLTALNGMDALEVVRKNRVDVVLADLMMPGMSGIELLDHLLEHDPNLVVVIITAYASLESAMEAMRRRAFDYLLKPFEDLNVVYNTVARAVDKRRQLEQQARLLEDLQNKAVISTGNEEIDDKMGGGVPLGSLTLIDGYSHAGKSVLAQQMIWGSLRDGFRLSLFTTENTVRSLLKQMQSLNIDVVDFVLLRRLRILAMEASRATGNPLDSLVDAIEQEQKKGCDMVFVDALTPLILSRTDEQVIAYFERCKRICSDRMTIVNVVHSHALTKELLVRITSLCDAHLSMRIEETGAKLVKVMEVAKVRGASKNTGNIVSFEIEPGLGIRIIPLSKAQG